MKQIVSLILPFTVLVIIPLAIENNISVRHIAALIAGIVLMITGLSLMIITISTFIRIGIGTLAPWSPTKKLVTTGLYGYVRNPMITGVLITLLGETVAVMSFNLLLWTVSFFILNNFFFLVYEEPDLIKRFGDEYLFYKRNVPRWIPKAKSFNNRK